MLAVPEPRVFELGCVSPLSEETALPSTGERWVEESREWLKEKQARGKYQGRNGSDALRFFRRCGEWVHTTPLKVTEADVRVIIAHLGPAPKTKRTYLALLASFLSSRGNWVVQKSGVRSEFPNRALNTPVITVEDRDRVLNAAQGQERVVAALYAVGRRRVEVIRARVEDFHFDRDPPSYDVRQKGGHDSVTDAGLELTPSLRRELAWYLPLRAGWGARATGDTGHLVCRWDGDRLVGVSYQYADRLLDSAEDRAGVRRWPGYSFRRGTATMLREIGADWEDVSGALLHSSAEITRQYVAPLVRRRRVGDALRRIEPAMLGGKP